MTIDRPLRIAFLFSIGFHSILLSPILSFINHPLKLDDTHIEVTYIDIKEEKALDTKPVPIKEGESSIKKEKGSPLEKEPLKDKEPQKDYAKKPEVKLPEEEKIKEMLAERKTIDLNTLSFQGGRSDSLNYLRAIRNKINTYVHRNYNASMGEGEALLHFILNKDGTVQSVSVVKDTLGENKRLKNLCLDSIYFCSPFKSFPKDLDLAQAAFNLSISFKNR